MTEIITAGTAKGLFVFRKVDGKWKPGVHFEGQSVYAVGRSGDRLWASPFTEWTGTALSYSDDRGETWQAKEGDPLAFPESTDTALAKIWQIASDDSGRMYFGVEPSALFTSDDGAATWSLVEGLWNHPHRERWTPGFGGKCLHTFLKLSDTDWVAGMSTGGVYRTSDAGENWEACNQKIVAPFLPEKTPEFGQCVHKIAFHSSDPETLFLQHHWGVYRSDDAGRSWINISEGRGLPSDFGFGCVSNKPGTAFIIPIHSDMFRTFPGGKARVYRTDDRGESWKELSKGLPQEGDYDCVLRDCFSSEGDSLAFGTTGGSLYFSNDSGDSWETVSDHLPRVTCVRVY
jgi:photosystem II stability/assembly factor-like uncharacterized protein